MNFLILQECQSPYFKKMILLIIMNNIKFLQELDKSIKLILNNNAENIF